jgi:O-antigen ligase
LKTLVEWGVVGLAALVVILTLFVRGALALRRRLAGEQNDAYHFAAVFLFATAVYVVQGLFTDTPPFLYLNGLYFFLAGVVYAQLDACDAASEQGTVAVGLSATARA